MQEIALHIMDIVENSITAGADYITVLVDADESADMLSVEVRDNGKGMDGSMLRSVTSPFTTTRTTRKVGMGIPLFKAGAEAADGRFEIESELGRGTVVRAVYRLAHIDRPPLGNLAETFYALVLSNQQIGFVFKTQCGNKQFVCGRHGSEKDAGRCPVKYA